MPQSEEQRGLDAIPLLCSVMAIVFSARLPRPTEAGPTAAHTPPVNCEAEQEGQREKLTGSRHPSVAASFMREEVSPNNAMPDGREGWTPFPISVP